MSADPRFNHIRDELRKHLLQVSTRNQNSMNYFKRRWDDSRADEYAAWGGAVYYFEVAPDGTATRQMEIYDSGTVLQYHADRIEDVFGFLTDQPIDRSDFFGFSISREEFETAWTSHPPTNRE
jgi:hypothetical protein